eukprot:Blabericola_migrator_1__5858@NODE_2968_length_2154_cov_120_389554_g1858_i0_p1_GENE_NODE_2968_length_2154_cov_120_389554_g1858_i0NODE_2968_length_2154_cov_120_389554_g1858_i0_p1_ORF_typecomplete_len329_score41_16DUF2483/PF10656_9/15DUF2483/PF10656_9/15DUF1566/PF07603_11/0_97_NODE_2968_length_2154_cov_120_389554_g1858_i01801166
MPEKTMTDGSENPLNTVRQLATRFGEQPVIATSKVPKLSLKKLRGPDGKAVPVVAAANRTPTAKDFSEPPKASTETSTANQMSNAAETPAVLTRGSTQPSKPSKPNRPSRPPKAPPAGTGEQEPSMDEVKPPPRPRKTYAAATRCVHNKVSIRMPTHEEVKSSVTTATETKETPTTTSKFQLPEIHLTAIWVTNTPDPDKVSYAQYRTELRRLGAPQGSIRELRHPLRNVLEIITTEEHLSEVTRVASMMNPSVRPPSPYSPIWTSSELASEQILSMALKYAKSVQRYKDKPTRTYLRTIALQAKPRLTEAQFQTVSAALPSISEDVF